MTGNRPGIVVRRSEIERSPAPVGGSFRSVGALPRILARFASTSLGVFCVNTTDSVIALTYDDGPHPVNTPRILASLARHGATATFFVLAAQVARFPEVARQIVAEGHEIALHGEDHRSLLTMKTADALAGVRAARASVESVVGRRIRLYRPPYGEFTSGQARSIRRLGLELVIWSGDCFDWRGDEPRAIIDRAVNAVFPGAILLLHDNQADSDPTAVQQDLDRTGVTEAILDHLAERRYRADSVETLLSENDVVRSVIRRRRHAS